MNTRIGPLAKLAQLLMCIQTPIPNQGGPIRVIHLLLAWDLHEQTLTFLCKVARIHQQLNHNPTASMHQTTTQAYNRVGQKLTGDETPVSAHPLSWLGLVESKHIELFLCA